MFKFNQMSRYLNWYRKINKGYRQVSNIRRTLAGNTIVDHSDVFILDLIHDINSLGKGNCKMRRETLKFWVLVRRILQIGRYVDITIRPCAIYFEVNMVKLSIRGAGLW